MAPDWTQRMFREVNSGLEFFYAAPNAREKLTSLTTSYCLVDLQSLR